MEAIAIRFPKHLRTKSLVRELSCVQFCSSLLVPLLAILRLYTLLGTLPTSAYFEQEATNGAPGLTTRSKNLLGAKGTATNGARTLPPPSERLHIREFFLFHRGHRICIG